MRLIILVILATLSAEALSAETAVSGSNCHSITPAQANLMEWRPEGLKNSAVRDYYINCPFEREAGKAELELKLRAVNETNGRLELTCNFKEFFGGTLQQGRSLSTSVNGGGYQEIVFKMKPRERDSTINATCLLTEGLAVEATSIGFSDSCSYDNFSGGWSYAFSYGYDGFEIGVGFLDDAGNITGQATDGQTTADITGFYEVDPETCGISAEVDFGGGVTVGLVGFLSEDQNTIVYASRNSYGYFSNGVMARLSGIGQRGRGTVGRVNIPSLSDRTK